MAAEYGRIESDLGLLSPNSLLWPMWHRLHLGNPRYETLCNLAAGLGIPITVLVQYEDMMLLDIYIESAKELLILFNELNDEERKKLSQLILIFQRINSWKEKD